MLIHKILSDSSLTIFNGDMESRAAHLRSCGGKAEMKSSLSKTAHHRSCGRKAGMKSSSFRVARLNEEFVELCILPRLPAKALLRFKCASRRWYRLISNMDPYFTHLHCQAAPSNLLHTSRWNPGQGPEESFVSGDPRFVAIPTSSWQIQTLSKGVVASCNGLVCMLCMDKGDCKLYLGNPFFRDWRLLPPYPNLRGNVRGARCGRIRSGLCGLAVDVDESAVSYKLVVACDSPSKDSSSSSGWSSDYMFEILSSTTGRWELSKQKISLPDPNPFSLRPHEASAYIGGVLYWECMDHVLWFNPKGDRS